MQDNALTLKLLLTGVVAAGSAIWGWFGWLVVLWCATMVMDYLTGSLAAMKEGRWSSAVAREGLWHKGGMILIVLTAALTDAAITLILRSGVVKFPFDSSVMVSVIVLAWYTLTELGSMIENASKLTDKVPPWLLRLLAVAAKTVDHAGEALAGEDLPSRQDLPSGRDLPSGQDPKNKGGGDDAQQP